MDYVIKDKVRGQQGLVSRIEDRAVLCSVQVDWESKQFSYKAYKK